MNRGIILYGPPASGKSTLTRALTSLDPRFVLLRKLKAGNRRGASEYVFVGWEELAQLRAQGRLLVESERYGNAYAISVDQLAAHEALGQVPIAHMGNIPDLRRLAESGDWLTVLLWIPRAECLRRSRERDDPDTTARLIAWDETLADLEAHGGEHAFDLRLDSDQAEPAELASAVASLLTDRPVSSYLA
ncbi:guanylate kinase [Nonomuraea soli]|uniref:Guanylate kinase n=1 Tax=Nonomuraea soli TaxID=1032476 RepID=A0A7W0CQQ1_9ACTN|nr:guanylate kinase [Nonomuraea soli]MBA2895458.1 guanylate kinase [Nonomuraea soli]